MIDDEIDAIAAIRAIDLAVERVRSRVAHAHGVPTTDTVALSNLAEAGGELTARDLAEGMGMSSGSVTAVIDRLEANNYATRNPNPDDRRSYIVRIEPAGRRVIETGAVAIRAAFADLDAPTRADLLRGMLDLAAAIEASTPEAIDAAD